MSHELVILTVTAASVGLIHTLIGPDHYLPFIVLAKARNWSVLRTGWITFLCGLGLTKEKKTVVVAKRAEANGATTARRGRF